MVNKNKIESKFKPINVAVSDWKEYTELAAELSVEYGVRVSVAGVIRKAITALQESRK